ncbi:helix-turn-helix domain-containing protein [Blautia sp.]|uniref:helix-turn-helix domain-containing protein n=1 Tax=Blautia sp. TaxID=1955243 RepID=UPI003AB443B2
MAISYNKLWKLLIDKDMKRKELKDLSGVSQNVMSKLSKNQAVSMDSMEKICEVLRCDIGDVMEFIHTPTNVEK